VLNVLVGNADCHGKNISIVHHTDGTIQLAPLYDVMSTVIHHPIATVDGPKPLTDRLGMAIGRARALGDVTIEDFVIEAAKWPIDRDTARERVHVAISQIVVAAQQHHAMYPEIAEQVIATANRLTSR
jgi:serine/threonine-protein kinase HipA